MMAGSSAAVSTKHGRTPRFDQRGKSQHGAVGRSSVPISSGSATRRSRSIEQFLDALRVRNDGPGAAVVEAVFDGVGPEQREQRQGDRAEPIRREMDDQRLGTLRQQDADAVATRNAVGGKRIGKPPRALLEMVERELGGASLDRFVDQGGSACPGVAIAYRLRNVEASWHGPGKARANLPVRPSG